MSDRKIIDAEYQELPISDSDIIEKDKLKQMKEMKEHLIELFSNSSVLYQIYEERGWTDKLFTDKILLMDRHKEYSTQEVADILDTKPHVINNKRRVLKEYIQPIEYEHAWRHDYISVFKLKMVHELTGDEGDFTLPQIQSLLSGHRNKDKKTMPSDKVFEEINDLKKAIHDLQNELKENKDKLNERDKALHLLLEKMEKMHKDQQRFSRAMEILKEIGLYTVDEKDGEIIYLPSETLKRLPMSEEMITEKIQALQDLKEQRVKDLMAQALKLYERSIDDSLSIEAREIALSELQELIDNNPNHSFEIRKFIVDAKVRIKDDKRGFFSRLFGKKK